MADTATLQLRLAEAELAYHRLQTGTKQVAVQQDDMQVTFQLANIDRLRTYIAELKSQLATAGVLDSTAIGRRRPMYVEL